MSKSRFSPESIGPGEKKDFDFDFEIDSYKNKPVVFRYIDDRKWKDRKNCLL